MFNAIIDSVKSGGVNVIDTAINYRYMKSERVIGACL
jgi:aryl-alcohol dehydrogenase-like predicted oxidoreductase